MNEKWRKKERSHKSGQLALKENHIVSTQNEKCNPYNQSLNKHATVDKKHVTRTWTQAQTEVLADGKSGASTVTMTPSSKGSVSQNGPTFQFLKLPALTIQCAFFSICLSAILFCTYGMPSKCLKSSGGVTAWWPNRDIRVVASRWWLWSSWHKHEVMRSDKPLHSPKCAITGQKKDHKWPMFRRDSV